MKPILAMLATCALLTTAPVYVVLLKGTGALGYYTPEGKLLAAVPVGSRAQQMAFSADKTRLYVSGHDGGGTVSIIDVAARKKIAEIPLREYRHPQGIAVDPGSGRIAVTAQDPDRLLILDPQRRSIVRTFDTKGKTPRMVSFGPGGEWAYVSNAGEDTVSAVNTNSGEVRKIRTGASPEGSVLSRDGRELYVTNREADSISVIDTGKNQAIAHIPAGNGPARIALTPDGSTLVYALVHENKVAFADPRIRKQTDYLLLPNHPVSLALSDDGRFAFAAADEADLVYVISLAERKLISEIETATGARPDAVAAVDVN